jgi:hypothetical protein
MQRTRGSTNSVLLSSERGESGLPEEESLFPRLLPHLTPEELQLFEETRAAMTNNVMLWEGSVAEIALPARVTLLTRVRAVWATEAICQACALAAEKLAKFRVSQKNT